MKKIIITLAAVVLPLLAGAQAQITTKKVKLGDFNEKVTKVVLNGNTFFDSALKDEVAARWRISPYEFCTLEEFEQLKGSDQYYFLLTTQGQFRKETAPGIQFLTLVKGGKGADKGIDSMLEVISMPVASTEFPSGRELIFLPAFLDIIQSHTLASMEKDFNAYGGLGNTASDLNKSGNMMIVFSEDDLSKTVTDDIIDREFDEDMIITDEEGADQYMNDNAEGTLVSYVVAPSEPVHGSYCYNMLIDSQTHKLYFFRKHRINRSINVGFTPEDLVKITAPRTKIRK
ncbi:MAG: hypothetical protein IJ971_03435 [Bacteroidales bacterium]|nr:hypothetical protein [Bacteroidales bacterium]